MDTSLAATEIRGLARAIARGRSATSWARSHDARIDVAQDSCTLPEFRSLVEAHRLQVTEQIVGKLMTRSQASVDQLRTVSQYSPDDALRVSASRTLLNQWLKIAGRFDTARQIAAMKAELTALNQK